MKKALYAIMQGMVLAIFFSIAATSYFPEPDYLPVGRVVQLFQSGTKEIGKGVSLQDTMTVYEPGKSCELKEVGRIEVVSFSGRYYLSGKVLGGEIKAGDIAKKDSIACIIIPSDWMCTK